MFFASFFSNFLFGGLTIFLALLFQEKNNKIKIKITPLSSKLLKQVFEGNFLERPSCAWTKGTWGTHLT
jgi:hypothetical protein